MCVDEFVWMSIVCIFRYGIYPLTAFKARQPPPPRPRPVSPEVAESVKSVTPEPVDVETRRVVNMMCNVKPRDEGCELQVRQQSAFVYRALCWCCMDVHASQG
jgi:hypothetical protein